MKIGDAVHFVFRGKVIRVSIADIDADMFYVIGECYSGWMLKSVLWERMCSRDYNPAVKPLRDESRR